MVSLAARRWSAVPPDAANQLPDRPYRGSRPRAQSASAGSSRRSRGMARSRSRLRSPKVRQRLRPPHRDAVIPFAVGLRWMLSADNNLWSVPNGTTPPPAIEASRPGRDPMRHARLERAVTEGSRWWLGRVWTPAVKIGFGPARGRSAARRDGKGGGPTAHWLSSPKQTACAADEEEPPQRWVVVGLAAGGPRLGVGGSATAGVNDPECTRSITRRLFVRPTGGRPATVWHSLLPRVSGPAKCRNGASIHTATAERAAGPSEPTSQTSRRCNQARAPQTRRGGGFSWDCRSPSSGRVA